jgi:hypothetical protein
VERKEEEEEDSEIPFAQRRGKNLFLLMLRENKLQVVVSAAARECQKRASASIDHAEGARKINS